MTDMNEESKRVQNLTCIQCSSLSRQPLMLNQRLTTLSFHSSILLKFPASASIIGTHGRDAVITDLLEKSH